MPIKSKVISEKLEHGEKEHSDQSAEVDAEDSDEGIPPGGRS